MTMPVPTIMEELPRLFRQQLLHSCRFFAHDYNEVVPRIV